MNKLTFNQPIALLWGGNGAEREVSAVSAAGIAAALNELQIPYQKIDAVGDWVQKLTALNPPFAFIAMHGDEGEDGTVQQILENLQIPYNGSGVAASALAMDKPQAKAKFATANIDTAAQVITDVANITTTDFGTLKLPAFIKPANGGSSVGAMMIKSAADWPAAFAIAQKYNTRALVEEFIPGAELTVAVFNERALGVLEIAPAGDHPFYDYAAKYSDNGYLHFIPPRSVSPQVCEKATQAALKAHQVLGCSGVTRADFRYDEKTDRLVILEVNTLPGFTPTSLVPEIAAYAGITYSQLVKLIIEDGLNKYETFNKTSSKSA